MPKSLLKKNYREHWRFSEFKREAVILISGSPQGRERLTGRDGNVFLMASLPTPVIGSTWSISTPDVTSLAGDECHRVL